jgi:uncharacterized protein YggT (Ycf19 family)
MDLIDWLLNLACVLLWLNWRAVRFTRVPPSIGVSLAGTLRRAEPVGTPRWSSLAALAVILFVRGLFYFQIGSAINWMPRLQLGGVVLGFRTDQLSRMWLFSLLGFGFWLCGLYSWLLLLSAVNRPTPEANPWQRLTRLHLGNLERLPVVAKLLLPALVAAVFWITAQPLLSHQGLIPHAESQGQVLRQAALLGLSTLLFWKLLLVGILVLHIINSYLYLGNAPFWQFVSTTAKHLVTPLTFVPLRIGKIDFTPLASIIIVLAASELINRWLPRIYQRL